MKLCRFLLLQHKYPLYLYACSNFIRSSFSENKDIKFYYYMKFDKISCRHTPLSFDSHARHSRLYSTPLRGAYPISNSTKNNIKKWHIKRRNILYEIEKYLRKFCTE